MVGAVIGWFFLGLLGLLLLVLLVPSAVTVQWENSVFTLWVRVLFIKVRVLPARPRKPKKPKPPKPQKKKAGREKKAPKAGKKRTIRQWVALGKRLAAAGLAAMRVFMRHLRIRKVQLVLPVRAEEAADTAIRCGQVQMAIGAARALLAGRLNVRYKKLVVMPDFTGQSAGASYFSCKAVFCLGIIFVMGAVFLRRYLTYNRRPYTRADYLRAAQRRAAQNDDTAGRKMAG